MKIVAILAIGSIMASGAAFAAAPVTSDSKQTVTQDRASGPVLAGGPGRMLSPSIPRGGKGIYIR
ncbi:MULTISPECIES: hypothetical protein [Brucella/Ochrobactrum group]|jgi:hypothetical protein|uniref:hypothetical protein n=1 Tax=Brucella/Ochrobactrum group TaxID=2826938 RepID=UPI001C0513AA|nr:hypothetical protein [Brucella sp. NBRC 12950]QWK80220.1 hypothetical protein KMS41_15080 [Ochrobactrum sp. BTU1]GLU25786.1 hypothetical protein Brsp01_10190 [Brucella sp. NBRC 12950]